MEKKQVAYAFDKASIIKIGKGAVIAGGAVAVLYILEVLTQLDFGSASPVVVGILSILINAIKEYIRGEKIA
jgi:hypothetical protein